MLPCSVRCVPGHTSTGLATRSDWRALRSRLHANARDTASEAECRHKPTPSAAVRETAPLLLPDIRDLPSQRRLVGAADRARLALSACGRGPHCPASTWLVERATASLRGAGNSRLAPSGRASDVLGRLVDGSGPSRARYADPTPISGGRRSPSLVRRPLTGREQDPGRLHLWPCRVSPCSPATWTRSGARSR